MRDLQLLLRYCLFSTLLALALLHPGPRPRWWGARSPATSSIPRALLWHGPKCSSAMMRPAANASSLTAESGTFSAPSVAVGVYTVSVSRDGFAPLSRTGIALTVGQNVQLHLALTVGSVQQSVSRGGHSGRR